MVSVKGAEVRLNKLMERFDHLQNNEKLIVGGMDSEVKRFIVSVLNSMLENYENEEDYFGYVSVLGDLTFRLSDLDTGYGVWCDVDFGKINSIGSGVMEDKEFIEDARDFYLK